MMINTPAHQILSVNDLQRTVEFYQTVFGKVGVQYDAHRQILIVEKQLIHLYCFNWATQGETYLPEPGTVKIHLMVSVSIIDVIIDCPYWRDGTMTFEGSGLQQLATGTLVSIYMRDPDKNLVQISNLMTNVQAHYDRI